jgi:hypothetical protein
MSEWENDLVRRVARLMVDAEPAGDLEARIRARLDTVRPTAAPAWWAMRRWQVAGGLAAAAVAAIAVLGSWGPEVLKSGGPEVPEVTVASLNSAATITAPATVPTAAPQVRSTSGLQGVRTSGPQDSTASLSSAELAWMERRIAALEPVTALHMDQLTADSIQPAPLTIPPIIMTALPTDGGTTERRDR